MKEGKVKDRSCLAMVRILDSIIYAMGSIEGFFFFWLHWVFVAARGLSLVAAGGATLRCGARASHCGGFSCCGAWALGAAGFSSCGTQAQ